MMIDDQKNTATTMRRSIMRRLLSGGAMALCLGALVAHAPAMAQASTAGQAFQGTPTVAAGSATIIQTAPLDTITVDTPQAVINWKPNDTSGTGTIDFLPVGRAARFTGFGDFTVLNRIIPVDGNDIPIARMIALNGTITSDLFGQQPGGNVWFYSPGGIFVGASGVINVGSLVLTSRDINTTGGLFGPSGQIRFRDPALAGTGASRVEIANGASITAFNGVAGSSYIALVAPRIAQAGTVRVDGSVALVAAEQADIRINNGLFDINILAGSSDANGIVHSGRTGGPSGAANRAYLVAVPKNQAMTMLLSGTIGFETVSTVTVTEGGIVLSAGHNIVGGVLSDSVNGNTSANIRIGDTTFLNTLDAAATDSITARPTTSCAPVCSAASTMGQIQFRKDATLSARRLVDLSIGQAQQIIAGGNLTMRAGANGTGGSVHLSIDSNPPPSAGTSGGGLISVAGQLILDASGHGFSPNGGVALGGSAAIDIGPGQLTSASILVRANGNGDQDDGGTGANGTGGTAFVSAGVGGTITTGDMAVEANGTSTALVDTAGSGFGGTVTVEAAGGSINVTNALRIQALGVGQIGTTTSGNGTGGQASLENFSGTLTAGSTTIDASGTGGGILDQLTNPLTPNTLVGGHGTGGTATLSNNGTSNLGALAMHADGIGGESQPTNNRDTARGGNGVGGTVSLRPQSGTLTVPLANLSANGHGGSSGGTLGLTGSARGGSVNLTSFGGVMQVGVIPLVDGNLTATANADIDISDGGTVATADGGTAAISSPFGGQIIVNNQIDIQATAHAAGNIFSPLVTASGNATGGAVSLNAQAFGVIRADTVRVDTSASSANATGTAGDATGGYIELVSFGTGLLSFTGTATNRLDANGVAGSGAIGGAGHGGTVNIRAASGAIMLGAETLININGLSGASALSNPPKTATGGDLVIEVTDESGSLLTFDQIYAAMNGGRFDQSGPYQGAIGQIHGVGGTATISFGGTTRGNLLSVIANGIGVNGGDGTGGTILFDQFAGQTNLTSLTFDADGFGGDGTPGVNAGRGGNGLGGTVTSNFSGGRYSGDEIFLSARGTGGVGTMGGTAFQGPGPGPIIAGNGGQGAGGLITILIGGPTDGNAQVSIAVGLAADASAEGGAGGDVLMLAATDYTTPGHGGAAQGGVVRLTHSGNQLSDGGDAAANIALFARAVGGRGGAFGYDLSSNVLPTDASHPDGGDAHGGTVDVTLLTRAAPDFGGAYTLDTGGHGGDGGTSLTGGNGGNGIGGTSRLTVDNVDAGLVAANFLSEGTGGNGADGINGAGGNGGRGSGGLATARVDGIDGALSLLGSGFQTSGYGGRGGHGFVSLISATIPTNGGDGGQGGDGTGGTIALEANDGTLALADPNGNGVLLASRGFGGNAGNGADNSAGPAGTARTGGNAGFGGVGNGGTVTMLANGGTITSDANALSIDVEVSGFGGAGANGGAGNAVTTTDPVTGLPVTTGGAGYNTGQSYSQAGLIRLEANDSADGQGLIDLSETRLLANGSVAGRVELIDNSLGAGLSFADLNPQAYGGTSSCGDFTQCGSGIYVRSVTGAIRVDGLAELGTDGTIQIDAAGSGGLDVGGAFNTSSALLIARHTNRGAMDRTVNALSIQSVASGVIDLQSGTLFNTDGELLLSSGATVAFDQLNSDNGTIRVSALSNIVGNSARALGSAFFNAFGNGANVTLGTVRASEGDIFINAGGAVVGGNIALGKLNAAGVIDIRAATLSGATSTLSAGETIGIFTSSDAQFGTLDADESITVTAGGAITGTRATTLAGSAGIALSGVTGVNVGSVMSGGETELIADDGAIVVGNLRSSGLIRADGRSVTIAGSGGLKFSALNATAGDARVTATSGDLTVQSGTVSGTATLITQGGDLTAQNFTGNRVVLNSNATARIAGTVTAATELLLTATGAAIIDGIATGGTVRMTSGDIVIGSGGRIGTAGTTSLVDLTNGDSSVRTYIGGADQANAYSLSAAEMLRLFGTNVTIRAPRVTAQNNAALGSSSPPDVIIGAFAFNGAMASAGNLGAGGTLSIITPGSARVVGAAELTNMTSGNGFAIRADQSIEVILGQGSIRLGGSGSNGLGGILTLASEDIAVATASAISDIASAPDIAAINTRLGRNDGMTSQDGALVADTINLNVLNGVYIQNSGASDRTSDRRGFTANAFNIETEDSSTRIVINGRVANPAGLLQTGVDAIRPTMINGVPAGAGGTFAQGSTINGCQIANPAACRLSFDFDPRDILHSNFSSTRRDRRHVRSRILLGLGRMAIHIRDVDQLTDQPLLDEPITGSGNDDLWIEDGDGE
ncbi:MAG: hypothetical protein ABL882_00480 [Sphingopyxis sp.]